MGTETCLVAFVCAAEIFGLAGFSLVPALLPQFIATWSLSNAEAGWLAGIMSAGYMAVVLPLVALTDRMPARTIFLASSALNALSCFGIAFSDGLFPALIWRAISGIAVAGMYMPGLRALTDGMAGASRARAAAWYTGSFTLGSSLSFLLGQAGIMWDWRGAFIGSGALGVIGLLLAWAALPHMFTETPAERPRAMPNFSGALGNRDVLVLTIGYTATIWGTAGLRQWIVVFLAFCVAHQGGATQGWSMLITGALVGLLGVPAGLFGNELSLRLGLRATAMVVFLLSALVNALFGFAALLPYGAVVALAMAAGFVVQGNFSNLTSGLLAVAEPRQRGATVAVYSCIGFAGGFIGTLLFGLSLDWFGGTAQLTAWVVAFSICATACLIGAIATAFLSRGLGSESFAARAEKSNVPREASTLNLLLHLNGDMKKSEVLAALGALAQETRLDIYRRLVQAGEDGLAAGKIGEELGLPSATLAFHLKELKHAGLVTFTREGRSLIYAAIYPTMNALLAYLTENCCGRPAAVRVPACLPPRANARSARQANRSA